MKETSRLTKAVQAGADKAGAVISSGFLISIFIFGLTTLKLGLHNFQTISSCVLFAVDILITCLLICWICLTYFRATKPAEPPQEAVITSRRNTSLSEVS